MLFTILSIFMILQNVQAGGPVNHKAISLKPYEIADSASCWNMDVEDGTDKTRDLQRLYAGVTINGKNGMSNQYLIRIFDAKTGNLTRTFSNAHNGPILSLSSFEDYLFSASADTAVKMWNVATGKYIKALLGHTQPINIVINDRKYIYSGSDDMTIKKWDIQTGSLIATYSGHTAPITKNCLALVPDSSLSANILYSCGKNGELKAWNTVTDKQMEVPKYNPTIKFHSIATPNPRLLDAICLYARISINGDKSFLSCFDPSQEGFSQPFLQVSTPKFVSQRRLLVTANALLEATVDKVNGQLVSFIHVYDFVDLTLIKSVSYSGSDIASDWPGFNVYSLTNSTNKN